MPCSCGNTNCPCGIPCCCSEESCKCQTCAIALSSSCKICNKPLITERQTDVDKCTCFIRESTALIFESQGNPRFRMGSMPLPVDYFVCGKLMVNVMIPVPVGNFPRLMHQQPVCLMTPPPSIKEDSGKNFPSFLADENVATTLCPKENSGSLSTSDLHQHLNESNEQFSNSADRPESSASICSNGEKITKISCRETCPSSELSLSTNENPIVNIEQNTKLEIKICKNEFLSPKSGQLLDKSSEQSDNHISSICLNEDQTAKTSSASACPSSKFSQSTGENQNVNIEQNTKLEIKQCQDEFLSPKSHQLLDKSSDQSGNHPSSSICLNVEQTAETSSKNECPSPGFSQSMNENHIANSSINKKSATEEPANIQDTSFYLPSITIGNVSHPVRLEDPIWRLPIPAFSSADNSDSSLNLHNPFYFSGLVNATETVAAHKKDCCLLVPVINSEGNGTQFFTKNENVQSGSTISLQMNESSLDPSKMSEQSNAVNDNKYAEFAVSHHVPEGNECAALNPIILPDGCKIATNHSILTEMLTFDEEDEPLCVASTSASEQRNHQQDYPTNGCLPWWHPSPRFRESSASETPNIQQHLIIPNQASTLQTLFTPSNINNRERDNTSFVSEMNRRNIADSAFHNSIPLYIDHSTTEKMEKLLKSVLNLNDSEDSS